MAKYRANPVEVEAFRIFDVGPADSNGDMALLLENGGTKYAGREMTARYVPVPGDYWVKQSDGYEYINPKDVFERKYSKVE